MEPKISIRGFYPRQLRARKIENPEQIILNLLKNDRRGIHIFNGGGITSKSYKYAAETEVLLVIVLSPTEYFADLTRTNAKNSLSSERLFHQCFFMSLVPNPFKKYKDRDEMILNKKLALIKAKKILHNKFQTLKYD